MSDPETNNTAASSVSWTVAAAAAVATSVPTLSEWGVIVLASLMAMFGIAATRRRQD